MNEWRPVSAVAFVLSRGFVPILALACIAIEISFVVYALSLRESSFLTRWDSIGIDPLVVGPLLAGATAWLMRRNHFTVREVLQAAPDRAARADIATLVAVIVVAFSVHLLAMLVAAVLLSFRAPTQLTSLWIFAVCGALGLLLTYIALGAVVGSFINTSAAPFLVALVSLLLPIVLLDIGLHKLFVITGGGIIENLDFVFVPRSEVVAAELLLGVGLITLAFSLVLRGTSHRPRLFAGVAGLTVALFAAVFLQSTADLRFWADDSAITVTCTGSSPEICFPPDSAAAADYARTFTTNLNREAVRLGLQPAVVHRVRAVGYGELQRDTARAPSTERWISVDQSLRSGSKADLLDNHLEQFVYPPKCFGTMGLVTSAYDDPARLFRIYLGYVGVGKPVDDPDLASVIRLDSTARDQWLRAAWLQVLACGAVPPVVAQ